MTFSKASCTDFELLNYYDVQHHFFKLHLQDASVNVFFRYLYADRYASAMWTGMETPESSGNYTSSQISFNCSKNSPMSPLPSLGYIYSFGEDNSKDVYVLASKVIYRVVRPSLCRLQLYLHNRETRDEQWEGAC